MALLYASTASEHSSAAAGPTKHVRIAIVALSNLILDTPHPPRSPFATKPQMQLEVEGKGMLYLKRNSY